MTDSLQIGGAERYVVDLGLALHASSYEVMVVAAGGGPLQEELEGAQVPVRLLMRAPVKRKFSLPYALRVRHVLLEGKFDVIHAHVYASCAAATLAALGTAIPLVVTEHSEARWQGVFSRSVRRRVYDRAAHVIAVSHPIRRRLHEDGVPTGKISVIPTAVLPPRELDRRQRLDLPTDWGHDPVIGVVARLQPEKGVDVLLDAAARIVSWGRRARFLIVGDGPMRPALVGRTVQLGLQQHVCFGGIVPQARALLPLLTVLAVPSRSEGAPLIVLEGMAAGVPIVASNAGGIPDQIRHEREGLLVPPADPDALAGAILRLIDDRELARRLTEAGRQRVALVFCYAGLLRRVEDVYSMVL